MIKVKHVVVLAFLVGMLPFCRQPQDPGDHPNNSQPPDTTTPPAVVLPLADAGPDQTTRAGSYALLDGSGSIPGSGEEIAMYAWHADQNNPARCWTSDDPWTRSDPTITLGFSTEGAYRFYLVVDDDRRKSEPDTAVITALPREPTPFEDPNLEIFVRFTLRTPLDDLADSLLLAVDTLESHHVIIPDVVSVAGLEHCLNLEYLGMWRQSIEELSPLAGLVKLEYLNLTQNYRIRDVSPLAGLTNLRYLDLDSNEITDISPLAGLTRLTYLKITLNRGITDISAVANMKELEQFGCSFCAISDLSPLAGLTNLWRLRLGFGGVNDISPLAGLTNLKLLYLKDNNITDISAVAGMTRLDRLYLSGNAIVDISPLQNLKSLPFLVISGNLIEDITALKHLTGLGLLSLSHNPVKDIGPLVENSGLDRGNHVFLHGCPLNEKSVNEYIPALRARGVTVNWP